MPMNPYKVIMKWISCLTAFGMLSLFSISAHGQSVETRSKVAPDQEPAFPGQTRAPEVQTETEYTVTVLADNLTEPWGLDFLPDGRMIVSEQPGNIRIVTINGEVGGPLQGVPPVRYQGSGGMYDLKLAPDFEQTRRVFWTYVATIDGEAMNYVASGRLSQDESGLEDVRIIYQIEPTRGGRFHFGSRLLFDREGQLYVTFGDHFRNGRDQVQQLDSALGKIIRIDQDGTPAEGNPYIGNGNALPEIWSIGHRNPQGLAFNPVTNELWETEHGPLAGDEINVIKPGENYGWPIISYGLEYGGGPVNGTGLTQREGLEQPVYYWDPAVAPSGMTFYTGDLIPEWKNNLFIAALRGMHIIRLVIDNAATRVMGEERLLAGEEQRFRYVVQGPDGALYATTDEKQGRIYRIGN